MTTHQTPAATTTDPVVAAITARLPGLRLLTDGLDREGYRDDETPYLHAGLPRAVVFPTTTADGRTTVSTAAKWFGLRFAGAEGNQELRWEIGEDAAKRASASHSREDL